MAKMTDQQQVPVLRIDVDSATPVYRQIVDGMRTLLVHGAFSPGDRLPTVRDMAIDLAIHHNTVAEAYRQLAEEGWLELRRHHGATVLARGKVTANQQQHDEFIQKLRELIARAISDGLDSRTIARDLTRFVKKLERKEIL